MKPEDSQSQVLQGGATASNSTPSSLQEQTSQKEATARLLRSQIDEIYASQRAAASGICLVPGTRVEPRVTSRAENNTTPTAPVQPQAVNTSPAQPQSQSQPQLSAQPQPSVEKEQPMPILQPAQPKTQLPPNHQTAPVNAESTSTSTKTAQAPTSNTVNPYDNNFSKQAYQAQVENLKKYHTAWQGYYQKYYERYYLGEVHKTKQQLSQVNSTGAVTSVDDATEPEDEGLSKGEALYELRQNLLSKIQESTKKVKKSHHFIPIVAALCAVLIFSFLQYNRIIFSNVAAYVSPGNVDPQSIVVDPTVVNKVSPGDKLIIPKINVEAPIIYGAANDSKSMDEAMKSGVAKFSLPGADSMPGQVGNLVLSGHSSSDIFSGGDYKYIFTRLDRMEENDLIYINYEEKQYTYSITKKEVVMPSEVNKLVYDGGEPILTLLTCTPIGTAQKRLLVVAKQVNPDPSEAEQPANESTDNSAKKSKDPMPGDGPSFLQRLFSWNWS